MFHKKKIVFLLSCFMVSVLGASQAHSDIITSTFDSNLEGWTGFGASNIAHVLSGGNPGGYMQLTDEAGPNGHLRAFAPSSFLGDLTVFDGGSISFDGIAIFTPAGNFNPIFGRIDIIGSSGTATLDIADDPTNQWTTYSTDLTAITWGKTELEWSAILGDVTGIRLWLEFDFGDEIVGIDNFALTTSSVPEPTTTSLLGALGIGLVLCRRRRRPWTRVIVGRDNRI